MPTLEWIGKEKVINHHLDVPYRVLERAYSYDENGQHQEDNGSENMIIHGDNLDALKALLPKFEGRIDCIYIDPPYNTGEENWIYNDNVNDPKIQNWLNKVVGAEGDDLSRHDKWLCMMYPRLKLLHKLLSEDGYIFISIQFNDEEANLRLICNEIFGANNFVGELTWESTTQPINSGSARFNLQQKVEPILLYTKNKSQAKRFVLREIENGLKYPHDGILGKCRFEIIEKSDAGSYSRPTMKFQILGQYPREGKRWQIGEDTARELERLQKVEIVNGIVKKAVYPEDELDKQSFEPFWSHLSAKEAGTAQSGKTLLNEIMGKPMGFDTVKPIELIQILLSHLSKDILVLDSFGGTGTTAHAVLNLNKQDCGNRKFILVEMMDYAENITSERVKRVIQGYGQGEDAVEGIGGNFSYYELGKPLLLSNGNLNEAVGEQRIKEYIWYTETKDLSPVANKENEPYYLGTSRDNAYYFYYVYDKATTLDYEFLSTIKTKADGYTIYADICTISEEELKKWNIVFKKIPRDIAKV